MNNQDTITGIEVIMVLTAIVCAASGLFTVFAMVVNIKELIEISWLVSKYSAYSTVSLVLIWGFL